MLFKNLSVTFFLQEDVVRVTDSVTIHFHCMERDAIEVNGD